ncbi:hypothetical protein CP973_35710 [Streptomyces albofaciens JCM 4342]|nr:hypothetical protein CP973_35710 [Streptomyces albofaciens JCM 4342]
MTAGPDRRAGRAPGGPPAFGGADGPPVGASGHGRPGPRASEARIRIRLRTRPRIRGRRLTHPPSSSAPPRPARRGTAPSSGTAGSWR